MDVDVLYKLKDNVQTVPHLILDLYYVDYSREEIDYNIIIALCIKYQIKTFETRKYEIRDESFLLYDFDSDFGSQNKNLFAYNIRQLVFDKDEFRWIWLCEFMLKHSAARNLKLLTSGTLSEFCQKTISDLILPDNFYIRNIFVDTNTTIYKFSPEDTKTKEILKRNKRIFSKKRNITTILLGISRFRNVSNILCKDVMTLIAKEIFYAHPGQVNFLDKKN
jgi:hypothetical protein